jgi:hypothetical protein
MSLFTQEEIDRITKTTETNDRMEEFFSNKREEWNKTMTPLYEVLKTEFNSSNAKNIMEVQALALSYRQMFNEQISFFLNRRSKEEANLKRLKQEKFMHYATGFGLKTNMGEKSILIDGHIAQNSRSVELIDIHVEFLRSCGKNCESLGFTIKNIIELYNYLK